MDKHFYAWEEFLSDVYMRLVPQLLPREREFNGVWGQPRGGIIMAVILSHQLDLPFVTEPSDPKTLVVDDIVDTGKTLAPYKDRTIVTLFYHQQSMVVPTIWLHEKKDRWIVFPWEKE